jgi:hypothetical protein
MLRWRRNLGYPLLDNGFEDFEKFRWKPLSGKVFGHLMIFLTIALAECQV